MLGGLLCTIVVLQFAGVIPWAGEEATFIGGPWTGVVIYAFVAGMMFAAGYAWLTIKPWASMIAILAAMVGFFVPLISHLDGTPVNSIAIAPLVVSVLMLFMVFRPATNRAMGMALSGQTAPKAPPPPKPMSAARKRELAEEQRKAQKKAQPTAVAAPAATAAAASASGTVTTQPAKATAAAPAPAKPSGATAATMVMSAAASLKAAAATPASPRRSSASTAKPPAPATPPKPAAAPPAVSQHSRPRGFRADEV